MEKRKWQCKMLKQNAKSNMKKYHYYWWAVLICLIISFVSGGFSSASSSISGFKNGFNYSSSISDTNSQSENTLSTPYDLGYVEGYQYGYESCQNGYEYSEDSIKQAENESTKEYIQGVLDGYHAGYWDCYNGNEYDSDPPTDSTDTENSTIKDEFNNLEEIGSKAISTMSENPVILFICLAVFLLIITVANLFTFLVVMPLVVGGYRFMQCARIGNVQFSNIGYSFHKKRFIKTTTTMFVMTLFKTLWSFLFIIPGIVKGYSYALVPYIMAENPNISTMKAIKISRQTMKGEKWHLFVLQISFILWYILGFILCCGVGMIFITPYIYATESEFYALMRSKALSFGYATEEDLPGFPEAVQKPNTSIPPYYSNPSTENAYSTPDSFSANNTDTSSSDTFNSNDNTSEDKINLSKDLDNNSDENNF